MTYHSKHEEAETFHDDPRKAVCFNCSKPLTGASIRYDGYRGSENGNGVSIYLHPACASEMAQRLISDYWPNRRSE